ncbi:hypothetical protein DFQ30_004748, partial [Apophysomyces sp. BC1015]
YAQQIVTLTYPHIGNVGVNRDDVEAGRVHAAGLVVHDLPVLASNFRSERALSDYLAAEGVLARSFPGLAGMDLAKVVSTDTRYEWTQAEWRLGEGYRTQHAPRYRVVAFDYGVKRNILRMLAERGCHVTVLPAQSSAADALALNPDGVFLSNGPGDPQPCDYAIAATREFIERGVPTFGICLGHQIMALAVGAKTVKMRTGHHGANHPVKDLDNGKVVITSQNHGFAVDASTLPANAKVTHVSLFDDTLQGFALTDKPAFCFQGHPEASPGSHDIGYLFDRFVSLIGAGKAGSTAASIA